MRGDTYPFKVLQLGEIDGTPVIVPCAERYGCPPVKVALCATQFPLLEDCPCVNESIQAMEKLGDLKYEKAMFDLKRAYVPFFTKGYHRFMCAITWVLLLPFWKLKREDRI